MNFRVGFGYDSHIFSNQENRPLKLGGVVIPGSKGLKGHSDADVLIHALIDALLGAVCDGNIGEKFPDSSAAWKDADSAKMLESVVCDFKSKGYGLVNMDATVICEHPRLSPHIHAIRETLAQILGVTEDCVSVKGKTNEKMDDVGAGMGIEVHCIVLVKKI